MSSSQTTVAAIDFNLISRDFSEKDDTIFEELFVKDVKLENLLSFLSHSKNRKPLEFFIYVQKSETHSQKLFDFCEILLSNDNIQSIYVSLQSDYKENSSRLAALSLISLILSINPGCAKLLLKRINFNHTAFRNLTQSKKVDSEDNKSKIIRQAILNISFAVFFHSEKTVEHLALSDKGLIYLIYSDIENDSDENKLYLLKILNDKLLNNEIISKNLRSKILTKNLLSKVVAVYKKSKLMIDENCLVCSEVLSLLSKLIKTKDGLVFSVRVAILDGRYSQVPNKFMLDLIFTSGLLEILDDESIREFIYSVLVSCPDIVTRFMENFFDSHKYDYSFDKVNEKKVHFLLDFLKKFYKSSGRYLVAIAWDLIDCVPKNVDNVVDILLSFVTFSSPLLREFIGIIGEMGPYKKLVKSVSKRLVENYCTLINWINRLEKDELNNVGFDTGNKILMLALRKMLKSRFKQKMKHYRENIKETLAQNLININHNEFHILTLPNGKNVQRKNEDEQFLPPKRSEIDTHSSHESSNEELLSALVGKKLKNLIKDLIEMKTFEEETLREFLPKIIKQQSKMLLIMLHKVICFCVEHQEINIFTWEEDSDGFNLVRIINTMQTQGNAELLCKVLLTFDPNETSILCQDPEIKVSVTSQKLELIKLIFQLTRLDPDRIKLEIHEQLLWSSYSGTMSECDIQILRTLYLRKPNTLKNLTAHYGGLLFGRWSLDHVKFCLDKSYSLAHGPLLWKSLNISAFIKNLDEKIVLNTINEFPVSYFPTWSENYFINESIYDPVFLIFLTNQFFSEFDVFLNYFLIEYSKELEDTIIEKGLLSVSIMGLSSFSTIVRQTATANIMRFLDFCEKKTKNSDATGPSRGKCDQPPEYKRCKLDYDNEEKVDQKQAEEKSKFNFQMAIQIKYLLTLLRQSIVPESVKELEGTFRGIDYLFPPKIDTRLRLTKVTSLFFARLLISIKKPSRISNLLWSMCLAKPTFKMTEVPDFLRFIYSTNAEYKEERLWMLNFILDAVRDTADFIIAERSHVTKDLLSLYCSPNLEIPAKVAIILFLRNVCHQTRIFRRLCQEHNFVFWIAENSLKAIRPELLDAFGKLFEIIKPKVTLLNNYFQEMALIEISQTFSK